MTISAPVLFLASDRELADKLGATRFMTKPFSNAEVLTVLREMTGGA